MLCPNFRQDGFCNQERCPHIHPDPNLICELCSVVAANAKFLQSHLKGAKHAAMLRARALQNVPKICTICDTRLVDAATESAHLNGQRHIARLGQLREQGGSVDARSIIILDQNMFECSVCEIQVWQQTKAKHEQTQRHKRKERFLSIRRALRDAEKDKHGVSVSPSGRGTFDLGLNESGRASLDFSVKIDNPKLRIFLLSATLSTAASNDSSFALNIQTKRYIPAHAPLEGTLVFNSQGSPGRFQDRIELVFFSTVDQRQFGIVKPVSITVGNQGDHENLQPIAPYISKKKTDRKPVRDVTEGVRPPPLAAIRWVVRLPEYPLPKPLRTILDIPSMKNKKSLLQPAFVPLMLSFDTHARRFHALLHMEEHQSEIDIQRYDQEKALLDQCDKLYFLTVPGLAEKRPSLTVCDEVLVSHHGSPKPHWWQGFVHVVELDRVGLRFNPIFNAFKGQKFDVRFQLNRLTLRRMHQALDSGGPTPRLLFPKETDIKSRKPSPGTIRTLAPVNRYIGQNPPQMLAVTSIRNLQPGSPPFVVFGPPGTGKTITIVESIRQILLDNPKARILACAPSNSAADIIAERLTNLGKSQLFRLNAPSRPASQLPAVLQQFSRNNGQGTFEVPNVKDLAKFRVVVSTCLSASVPRSIGIQPGHFSHVFVDEAGQACEPEALIAIKTLADKDCNLIISRDPKQLSCILRSDLAMAFGFGDSLLDRLTGMTLYDEKVKSGVTIVKLLQNFRSHPTILKYPNDQFYRGELECKADPAVIYSMTRADCIVKAGFPVVFHSIAGKDLREARSPSFFNVDEASLVKKYIQELKADQRLRLTDDQIGVISPYHAQCCKIRMIIRPIASNIKVGSVEEFQGQERRVIIVSTVRSNLEYVQSDIAHSLGFVAHPRRFNVAMTRAQALLVVIGDPNVLSLDPLWRGFLNYIFNNGGWTGRPKPNWNTHDPNLDSAELLRARRAAITAEQEELIKKVTETIDKRVSTDDIEDLGDGYEAAERPWRETE